MIETTARVVRLEGNTAWVRVDSPAGCGACGGRGCGTALFARLFDPREPEYPVANPIDARPGDTVVVGVEDGELLKAALAGYVLPLGLLVLGALLGSALGEAAAALGAALGLVLAWWLLRLRPFARAPVILRQLPPKPAGTHCLSGNRLEER
ncbi:MAG: SoxR reducing system RseC family protein [Thiobacillaceae bacterium]|nr:SoxR reducing system RseC family protein [Thiobacillaceae bacterium]MCX7673567.1 SoxR reducing system RseC family protein [Thiobacillaceae bacterium]MDW8323415.1 SoxR reducing system RseC family protein [Burkholderiales bacterium]